MNTPSIIFFDVDGTLSAPIYINDAGQSVIGFPDTQWVRYCEVHGADSYEFCKPVLPVKRYAEVKKAAGCHLYVLTTCPSEIEVAGKERFIQRCYPGLFDAVLHCGADKGKLDVMKETAESLGYTLQDCELVEDTYATLLYVMQFGVKPTHLSQLVCDL